MVRAWMMLAVAAALWMPAGPEAAAGEALTGRAVAEDATAEPPTVEALVSAALEQSAELRALEERIRAAEASVGPAGALPDPMGSVAISNVPVGGLELDRTPMSGVELGVSQGVPAAEKRRLRRKVRREEVEALRARHDDRRDDLVRRVRQGYIDLQYLDGALVIAEGNRDLARDFLATAEARYATGKGLQQDVFQAQVRLSRMMDTLISLRQRRAAAATRLNRLLYRPGEEAVPTLPGLTRSGVALAGESLGARAEAANPRLREARMRRQQAATRERLAEAGIRPDFTLGFRYRLRESVPMDPVRGDDFWSVSAGMTLPWVYRGERVDREVEAAEAEWRAAELDVEALVNELAARIEELVIETMRADEQIALVETGLLPQAEGALASSRAAYATGQVEFLTLLDNQMSLYQLQVQRLMLIAEHERNLAELEYVVGGSLTPAAARADWEVDTGVE